MLNHQTKTSEYDFELDSSLVAKYPLKDRAASRMLYCNRATGQLEHKQFTDIIDFLHKGDILVRNNSQVIPARFFVYNENNSKIEILLVKSLGDLQWEILAKPAKKLKLGKQYHFDNEHFITIITRDESQTIIEFQDQASLQLILDKIGSMPIPPYLNREAEEIDKERYQCVYAKHDDNGSSIAAPTAGLHFTDSINQKLLSKGIEIIDITLHVGLGTFQPIKTEHIEEHKMHYESYSIEEDDWNKILEAKKQKRRIISVGSTSTRVLESIAQTGVLQGKTNIFIYPGKHKFQIIDGMLTNFHLPKSTLILLVSAFIGKELTLKLYQEAIFEKYRFYSYGDCCLLL